MKGDGPIKAMTVQHGGGGGGESLNIELAGYFIYFWILEIAHSLGITECQKLIAVYGRRLSNASYYGEKKYVS